jgi:hypothetical protein
MTVYALVTARDGPKLTPHNDAGARTRGGCGEARAKGPVQFLVIDRVERPSENCGAAISRQGAERKNETEGGGGSAAAPYQYFTGHALVSMYIKYG